MVKASLYVGQSALQAQLINMLKTLAASRIDDKVVMITSELPEKLQPYEKPGYWLQPIGSYCLYLPESFFKPSNRRYFNKAFKTYETFLKPIVHTQVQVAQGMKKDYDPEHDGIRPLTRFSVICDISKKLTLAFLVTDPQSEADFFNQLQSVKEFVKEYLSNPKAYSKTILRLHKIDDKSVFLLWNHELEKWEFVNVLFLVGREKMLRYKKGFDNRFAKPLMIVNEKNLNHEMTFTSNWTLEGNRQHYTMNRPNDMAIYQSIANKALKRAQEKFQNIHSERVTELILPESQVSEFFDYFEEIIQAVIMSYTTIESMANSCIPFGHEYTFLDRDGAKKIYNKELIERWLPLREKLKSVIPAIVAAPSPANEKWWSSFKELEDLRNEIIHAKHSKAEIRYSMFLNERIFKVVGVHNTILSYYSKQFCDAKLYEMNQFPLNVGCDELIPGLMTEKNFRKSFKSLRNIPG
jgi:hypothetical protein